MRLSRILGGAAVGVGDPGGVDTQGVGTSAVVTEPVVYRVEVDARSDLLVAV